MNDITFRELELLEQLLLDWFVQVEKKSLAAYSLFVHVGCADKRTKTCFIER